MMPFNGTSNIGESLSREKDYEVVWDTFDMLLNKKQLNNNFKWWDGNIVKNKSQKL